LWNMDRVALGTLHRKTGYGDCLAPQRIPVVKLEGTTVLPGLFTVAKDAFSHYRWVFQKEWW